MPISGARLVAPTDVGTRLKEVQRAQESLPSGEEGSLATKTVRSRMTMTAGSMGRGTAEAWRK